MILFTLKAAATGLSAVLAASSAINMFQTVQLLSADELFPQSLAQFREQDSVTIVENLNKMKRKELLQVFLACDAPDKPIIGEWDGILLDNNSFVMVKVTDFLTNKLFGRGRKWNGKSFVSSSLGINRFLGKTGNIETQHNFDYDVVKSNLGSNKYSIKNIYWRHQFPLSLWSTMKDELRLIPSGKGKVLIGIGNMAWSGGLYNSSPFCLFRHNEANTMSPSVSSID